MRTSKQTPAPLDDVPPPGPAVTEAPRRAAHREGHPWAHAFCQGLGHLIVQKPRSVTLRFGLAQAPEELAEVGDMRRRVYRAKLPYLLQELSENGLDAHDGHSFVFAIWRGDQVVATIRATRYPYETLQYVPEADLARWLKKGWDTGYLELGRLLVETTEELNRLTPALIAYAGVYLRLTTAYRDYFGYTRPHARRSFGKFRVGRGSLTFCIPKRGEHHYTLLKGNFLSTVVFATPRWMGSFVKRMGQRLAPFM